MLQPDREDKDPQEPNPQGASPTRSSVLDVPSLFVGSIVQTLRRQKTESAEACAELLARQGTLTGADLSGLIENTLTHPSETSELLRAYSQLTRLSVKDDFAQGLPAFLRLAHKSLLDSTSVDDANARRVFRVLDRLLDAREEDEDLKELVDVVVGDAERSLLQAIMELADQKKPGYWECVELHGALFPDADSLEGLFRAVDRIGPGPHDKALLLGAQRSVAAIAAADFSGTFEFVARALGESVWAGDAGLRRSAAAGISFHAERSVDKLLGFLDSNDETLLRLACHVCVGLEQDREGEGLPDDIRSRLADSLRIVFARFGDRNSGEPLVDGPLIALAYISPLSSHIEDVGRVVRGRLHRSEPLSAEFARAYAEGLSRVKSEQGFIALNPLSVTRFGSLAVSPVLKRELVERRRVTTGQEMDDELEALALDISVNRRLEDILEMCSERQDLLDPRRLRSRESGSLSLFFDAKQALQFARHHASIASDGPAEFAAALLPELLSALEFGQSRSKRRIGEDIGKLALHSLASVAKLAVQVPRIRELAVARLSSADWGLLGRLHEINEKAFSQTYPELGMAGFAVRAVLDDDSSWQSELFGWWGSISPKVREKMDPNALAFVAVVAEQRYPGAVWNLLSQFSLLSEDLRTLSDIGLALLARREDAVRRMCVDILSEKGEEIGRSLLLAQLMAPYCSDAHRAHLVGAAKGHLDEFGVLGLDAAASLGALSRDRGDALLLIEREPLAGIPENVYRVSYAKAAAMILRNLEEST